MNKCSTLSGHITDSRFYSSGYSTTEARNVFCDIRRMQRWLDVEVTLAVSQAELGIIPPATALELERSAKLEYFDIDTILNDIQTTNHSLVPLLTSWQKVASRDAGQYIHYGATTQDIQDTAHSLEVKDILKIAERDIYIIAENLTSIAESYKSQVMIGRTHGQHALPTTFGLKASVWLDELYRNLARLEECKNRVLVSQLFGGVGTMDALGENGIQLIKMFSEKLGLIEPLTAWHSARDRNAELLSFMAITSGSFANIANEICQLSRNEIAELEEPFHMGKIGSTTMPHKRNPELCEQVVVLAKLIKSNAVLGFDALINEHERDYRAVRLEWVSITDASLFFCASLSLMKKILNNLIVHEKAMNTNVEKASILISTEALMFLLGRKIGKQSAHKLLYEASMKAYNENISLVDILLEDSAVKKHFKPQDLKDALKPANHTGLAGDLTDRMVTIVREKLNTQTLNSEKKFFCPFSDKQGFCNLNNK